MLKIWICLWAILAIGSAEEIDYHAHPKYSFEYGVNDPHTHDVKKHWETRDGDKVQGSYSLKEADGTVRIVDYHANDHTGFNAIVRREGHAIHPQVHGKVNVHETTHLVDHHGPTAHSKVNIHEATPVVEHHGPVEIPKVNIHETTHVVEHHRPISHPKVNIHEAIDVVEHHGPIAHPKVNIHEAISAVEHHGPVELPKVNIHETTPVVEHHISTEHHHPEVAIV